MQKGLRLLFAAFTGHGAGGSKIGRGANLRLKRTLHSKCREVRAMHAPDGICRKPAGAREPITGGAGRMGYHEPTNSAQRSEHRREAATGAERQRERRRDAGIRARRRRRRERRRRRAQGRRLRRERPRRRSRPGRGTDRPRTIDDRARPAYRRRPYAGDGEPRGWAT